MYFFSFIQYGLIVVKKVEWTIKYWTQIMKRLWVKLGGIPATALNTTGKFVYHYHYTKRNTSSKCPRTCRNGLLDHKLIVLLDKREVEFWKKSHILINLLEIQSWLKTKKKSNILNLQQRAWQEMLLKIKNYTVQLQHVFYNVFKSFESGEKD